MYLLSVRYTPNEYRYVGYIPTEERSPPAVELKTWLEQDYALSNHGFPQLLMYHLKKKKNQLFLEHSLVPEVIANSSTKFSSLILFSTGSCGFHVNTSMSRPFETCLEEYIFCLTHINTSYTCSTCKLNELFGGGLVVLHTDTVLSSAFPKMHCSPPFCQLAYSRTGANWLADISGRVSNC